MTEVPERAGQKCRVCSMPIAAGLASCPSCAYDHRAAAEAARSDQAAWTAGPPDPGAAHPGRSGALGRWRSRRPHGNH
ncbi:MAG: hypothetical protein QOD01_803 [Actinomycetota bacterium]|nr:hypothetical protein [Actinomycetota bacterium]